MVALIQLGPLGQVSNVGAAHGISVRTLLDQFIISIVSAGGHELCCQYAPARVVDVVHNVVANVKMLHYTGIALRIRLEEGLRETLAWLKTLYLM